jgi:hypothetical protein
MLFLCNRPRNPVRGLPRGAQAFRTPTAEKEPWGGDRRPMTHAMVDGISTHRSCPGSLLSTYMPPHPMGGTYYLGMQSTARTKHVYVTMHVHGPAHVLNGQLAHCESTHCIEDPRWRCNAGPGLPRSATSCPHRGSYSTLTNKQNPIPSRIRPAPARIMWCVALDDPTKRARWWAVEECARP